MSKVPPLRCDALATHHNRWGFRGVEQVKPGRFRAVVGNHANAWRSPYFATPHEAAAAYDREARRRYASPYLNFPAAGEQRCEPGADDVCSQGHSREQFTYSRPSGKLGYCILCNKQAQKRSAARRKART
jgi:hypothetical protein